MGARQDLVIRRKVRDGRGQRPWCLPQVRIVEDYRWKIGIGYPRGDQECGILERQDGRPGLCSSGDCRLWRKNVILLLQTKRKRGSKGCGGERGCEWERREGHLNTRPPLGI